MDDQQVDLNFMVKAVIMVAIVSGMVYMMETAIEAPRHRSYLPQAIQPNDEELYQMCVDRYMKEE